MTKKLIILASVVLASAVIIFTWWFIWPGTSSAPENSGTEKPMSESTPTTQNTQTTPAFNKTKYSVDDSVSIWVIANKQRPLSPLNYAPADLAYIGGQQLRSEAVSALQNMIQAAQTEGLYITPLSGYRSYATQQSVYAREVATYGQAVADTQSARPGYSEHQTGWAIDVGGGGCGIEDCFGDTAEGKWVAANGYKYGFIIRYQPGKESITGYRAEPWHIRYVGTELATELQKTGQTLEEFFGLPAAPTY